MLAMVMLVTSMHEDVHQGARKKKKIGKRAQDMGSMFRQQVKSKNAYTETEKGV